MPETGGGGQGDELEDGAGRTHDRVRVEKEEFAGGGHRDGDVGDGLDGEVLAGVADAEQREEATRGR